MQPSKTTDALERLRQTLEDDVREAEAELKGARDRRDFFLGFLATVGSNGAAPVASQGATVKSGSQIVVEIITAFRGPFDRNDLVREALRLHRVEPSRNIIKHVLHDLRDKGLLVVVAKGTGTTLTRYMYAREGANEHKKAATA